MQVPDNMQPVRNAHDVTGTEDKLYVHILDLKLSINTIRILISLVRVIILIVVFSRQYFDLSV